MSGLHNVYFSSAPHWVKPVDQMKSCYSSFAFAFSDPDGLITKQLFSNKQALFGKQVQIERWVDKPPLIQCGRCHTLGHAASSKSCRLPVDSVKCYICGKGHLADTHNWECSKAKQHKMAGTCDCRWQCLTCNKFGHHAREPVCPAQEGFRPWRTCLNTRNTNVGGKPTDPPAEVPTQCSEPLANLQAVRIEDILEEEVLDVPDTFDSNFVPRNFLLGPGLSAEEAFHRMSASAGKKLEELGIPLTSQAGNTLADRESQARETERHM